MAVGTLHWNIYTLSISEGGLRGSCSPLPRAGNLILGLLMIWVRAGGAFGGVGIQQDLELNYCKHLPGLEGNTPGEGAQGAADQRCCLSFHCWLHVPLPFPPEHIQARLAAGAKPVLSQPAHDVTQGNRR